MQLHVASVDLKPAFDKVSPPSLSKAMEDFAIHPTPATAMLREQLGGKNDICFQETNRRHRFRQVHQTGRMGEPRLVKLGDEVLAETTVLEVQEAKSVVSDQEWTWRWWAAWSHVWFQVKGHVAQAPTSGQVLFAVSCSDGLVLGDQSRCR